MSLPQEADDTQQRKSTNINKQLRFHTIGLSPLFLNAYLDNTVWKWQNTYLVCGIFEVNIMH